MWLFIFSYSTHPFLQLWHCNSLRSDLRFGRFIVQIDGQEREEHGEELLRQRLGEMIGKIVLACDMSYAELFLLNPIDQPEEPHIHALSSLGIDTAISETHYHGVVDT